MRLIEIKDEERARVGELDEARARQIARGARGEGRVDPVPRLLGGGRRVVSVAAGQEPGVPRLSDHGQRSRAVKPSPIRSSVPRVVPATPTPASGIEGSCRHRPSTRLASVPARKMVSSGWPSAGAYALVTPQNWDRPRRENIRKRSSVRPASWLDLAWASGMPCCTSRVCRFWASTAATMAAARQNAMKITIRRIWPPPGDTPYSTASPASSSSRLWYTFCTSSLSSIASMRFMSLRASSSVGLACIVGSLVMPPSLTSMLAASRA